MWPMAVLVAVAVMINSPSWADVYKCPDGKGSVRYQNMPCVGEAAPLFESAPATEPSRPPAPPVQAPVEESSPASSSVSPPPPPPLEPAPQETSKTPAQPVDTLQFGLIRNGMTEQEVSRRLGKPAQVVYVPTVFRYAWVYPGTPQIMRTPIYFENGVVVDKKKTPESGVR